MLASQFSQGDFIAKVNAAGALAWPCPSTLLSPGWLPTADLSIPQLPSSNEVARCPRLLIALGMQGACPCSLPVRAIFSFAFTASDALLRLQILPEGGVLEALKHAVLPVMKAVLPGNS